MGRTGSPLQLTGSANTALDYRDPHRFQRLPDQPTRMSWHTSKLPTR